MLCSAQSSQC